MINSWDGTWTYSVELFNWRGWMTGSKPPRMNRVHSEKWDWDPFGGVNGDHKTMIFRCMSSPLECQASCTASLKKETQLLLAMELIPNSMHELSLSVGHRLILSNNYSRAKGLARVLSWLPQLSICRGNANKSFNRWHGGCSKRTMPRGARSETDE